MKIHNNGVNVGLEFKCMFVTPGGFPRHVKDLVTAMNVIL